MTTKFERQGEILRLVQQHALSTQAEVADALRAHGIDAVQATVSRDIAQLGLVKVRNDEGRLVYALPGAADLRRLDELTGALRHYLGKTTPSGSLLVVQTPRGFAARSRTRSTRQGCPRSPARSPATTPSSSRAPTASRRPSSTQSCGAGCEHGRSARR